MPMQETSLLGDATAIKITANGVDYPILLDTDTFDRVGEGMIDIPILPLCRGDEFVGEVLEGQWKKGWTGTWKAANPFTAILETTNDLIELGGLSNVQGVYVYGWIDGHHPIVMANATEVNVLLEVPFNAAAGVNQSFKFRFFITKDKIVSQPDSENDFIKIEMDVTNGGLLLQIYENIAGAGEALIFDGSTYDGATNRAATGRVTIWRIVFHDGVSGDTAPGDVRHMHIYLKQGTSRANAEAATEYELIDAATPAHASPYDISAYLFTVGYPAYEIGTEDDTVNFSQTSDDEAMSDYLRVDYSAFSLKYDFVDADVGKGDCEIWDGDPDVSTSVRVYDEDHIFANDVYLQNGLIRMHVDDGILAGMKLSYYDGATWTELLADYTFYLETSIVSPGYPYFKRIISVSTEKTIIEVKMADSPSDDDDYFVTIQLTLERGKYTFKMYVVEEFPSQDFRFWVTLATNRRFGYAGDDTIADEDLALGATNTTLTDNFMERFDDAGETVILTSSSDDDESSYNVNATGRLYYLGAFTGGANPNIWIGVSPFSLIAQLFVCASTVDKDVGGDAFNPNVGEACDEVLRMAAQTDGGHWHREAGTHLPEGRYLVVIRDYAITGNQNYDARVYNGDATEYRNEEGVYVTFQAQVDTWTYRSLVFDITAADVATTDDIWIQVVQPNAGPNTVYIDYFLIIPIGNGESWPQDLAHAAMRNYNKPKRLFTR